MLPPLKTGTPYFDTVSCSGTGSADVSRMLCFGGSVESGCAAVTLDSEPGLLHLLQVRFREDSEVQ